MQLDIISVDILHCDTRDLVVSVGVGTQQYVTRVPVMWPPRVVGLTRGLDGDVSGVGDSDTLLMTR